MRWREGIVRGGGGILRRRERVSNLEGEVTEEDRGERKMM